MKKILSIIENVDGSISSRRVAGLILVGVGIAGAFLKWDTVITMFLLGTGAGLLGLTTADAEVLPK